MSVAALVWLSCGCGWSGGSLDPRSVRSLRERAEQGDAASQYRLGFLYERGQGVPQDHAAAIRWYRQAAEQGNTGAQLNLGVMYDRGVGVVEDYAEAIRWFRKAAEQGEARAQYNLGLMYSHRAGVEHDYVQAHMWFNLATSRADRDDQKTFAEARDGLARKMKQSQIAEAQRRARDWVPNTGETSKGNSRK